MEHSDQHNINGPERHGRRERPPDGDEAHVDPHFERERPDERAIEDVIGDGIVEARNAGRHIDHLTARAIARSIALALGERGLCMSAFASTGTGDRHDMEVEYLDLYHRLSTPGIVKQWIDLLARFLLDRDYPGSMDHVQTALPNAAEIVDYLVPEIVAIDGTRILVHRSARHQRGENDPLPAIVTSFVTRYGVAARAYLTLTDVDAGGPRLSERFEDEFVAAFDDASKILPALSDYDAWVRELDEWAAAKGLPVAASLDQVALEALVRDVFDIVEVEGHWYAFAR